MCLLKIFIVLEFVPLFTNVFLFFCLIIFFYSLIFFSKGLMFTVGYWSVSPWLMLGPLMHACSTYRKCLCSVGLGCISYGSR